jgi:hypothetical protein
VTATVRDVPEESPDGVRETVDGVGDGPKETDRLQGRNSNSVRFVCHKLFRRKKDSEVLK